MAIAIARYAGDAREDLVGKDREVRARSEVPAAKAAGRRFDTAALASRPRLARVELDRSALRVHAGERALRATQNFNAIEIDEIEGRRGDRSEVDVVDVDADARLHRGALVRLTDAANERAHRIARARWVLLEQHVRCLRGNLPQVRLAARFQHVAGDGGDRERNFLHALFAHLRGHHDFGQRIFGAGGLLCRRHTRCRYQRAAHGATDGVPLKANHRQSPLFLCAAILHQEQSGTNTIAETSICGNPECQLSQFGRLSRR